MYAECREYALMTSVKQTHYTECCYAECRYAECRCAVGEGNVYATKKRLTIRNLKITTCSRTFLKGTQMGRRAGVGRWPVRVEAGFRLWPGFSLG
jgi:hypothetical protein